MKTLIVYGSRHGNTEKIASAVATGLGLVGPVALMTVDQAHGVRLHEFDLVVVGGPTEGHSVTQPVAGFVEEIGEAFTGVRVAAFDTRVRWPRWLSGSAAITIAGRLEKLGANLAVEPVSFIVSGNPVTLDPGELERAEAWGRALALKLAPQPVA